MLHVLDYLYYGANGVFECLDIPLGLIYDLLPVPLVNVDAVSIIKLLIASDGVHIGIETLTLIEAIFLECISLPLSKRLHNLELVSRHFF